MATSHAGKEWRDYDRRMAEDSYTVERSVRIDAPSQRIYDQIADFRNWTSWSPWEGLDPDLERSYTGAESGEGAVYGWSGNRKAGQGHMEVTEADQPSQPLILNNISRVVNTPPSAPWSTRWPSCRGGTTR